MRHLVSFCFLAAFAFFTLEGTAFAQSPADTVRAVLAAPDSELSYERAKLTFDALIAPEMDEVAVTAEIDQLASAANRIAAGLSPKFLPVMGRAFGRLMPVTGRDGNNRIGGMPPIRFAV